MKTHKEMLKLVLEAFKLIASQDQGCGGNVTEAEAWKSAQSIALANITAIKEALAQSKEHLPNMSEINRTIAYSAAATLHELGYEWKDGGWIAQQKEPEPEPVGHFYFDEGQWKQARDPISFPGCTKLYKAPQRKPLTRDQVKEIMLDDYKTATMQERADFMTGFRAAEAAHGIKE